MHYFQSIDEVVQVYSSFETESSHAIDFLQWLHSIETLDYERLE